MKIWIPGSKEYNKLLEKKIRLLEDKNRLIDKLDITDEQKTQLKGFFRNHPNYESKIDWNKRNLTFDDFKDVLALDGKSRSQARKKGISGLVENEDYKFVTSGKTLIGVPYDIYVPLSYLGSVTLASPKVGPAITGEWCISSNDSRYWNMYTNQRGSNFCFVFIYDSDYKESGTKFALQFEDGWIYIWDAKDTEVFESECILESSASLNALSDILGSEDFDCAVDLASIILRESDKIFNSINGIKSEIAERNERYYDNIPNIFFTKDGWFNFGEYYKIINTVYNLTHDYVKHHPIHITVPSNYPGDIFPNINSEDIIDNFRETIPIDDWDSEDVSIWSVIDCLDLSQTKITKIDSSFTDCDMIEIKNIVFPKTLKVLEDNALCGFSYFKELDFRNTQLEEIGDAALSGAICLEHLYLPRTIKKLGNKMVPAGRGLRDITFDMTLKEFLKNLDKGTGKEAFKYIGWAISIDMKIKLIFSDGKYDLMELWDAMGLKNEDKPEVDEKEDGSDLPF